MVNGKLRLSNKICDLSIYITIYIFLFVDEFNRYQVAAIFNDMAYLLAMFHAVF